MVERKVSKMTIISEFSLVVRNPLFRYRTERPQEFYYLFSFIWGKCA